MDEGNQQIESEAVPKDFESGLKCPDEEETEKQSIRKSSNSDETNILSANGLDDEVNKPPEVDCEKVNCQEKKNETETNEEPQKVVNQFDGEKNSNDDVGVVNKNVDNYSNEINSKKETRIELSVDSSVLNSENIDSNINNSVMQTETLNEEGIHEETANTNESVSNEDEKKKEEVKSTVDLNKNNESSDNITTPYVDNVEKESSNEIPDNVSYSEPNIEVDKKEEYEKTEVESENLIKGLSMQDESKVQEDTNQEVETQQDEVKSNLEGAEADKESNYKNESGSSQSNLNTSTEPDEENLNKSDNDGAEVMDTEIVNCNEIEQIDLSENESQRDKEIDRIGIETDFKDENKDVFQRDTLEQTEKDGKINNQKNSILINEDAISQPGNSEEETITGDTTTAKDKDEEVCIIPDDMPRISIHDEQNKNENKKEVEKSQVSDKSKRKVSEKKSEGNDCKPRPLRNAAKLAGNKIKSLVESDMVYEDQTENGVTLAEGEIHENTLDVNKMCTQCKEVKVCKFVMVQGDGPHYLCSEQCSSAFKSSQMEPETNEIDTQTGEFVRKCAQCHSQITVDEKCLLWETMDFCNEDCLGKYQTELGSNCANCKGTVASSSLGKYCVRFGYDVKQFCSASCLEEYKKGLKVCSYCQKDISTGAEGFLAPVGDKGQFKDFCTQSCMEKYERMKSSAPPPDVIEECAVCSNSKPVRVEVELESKTHKLCSEPCFAAFKFVNNITEGQCDMCRKYFDRTKGGNLSIFYDESPHSFCCKTCMNVYILANRKIVPCNWCKVKKYNFDMIKKVSANGQLTMMCSLNCLMLYQVSVNAVCSRRTKCDFCLSVAQAQYHLTMSDATIRNFCSYNCVMSFQVMKKTMDFALGEAFTSLDKELHSLQFHNQYSKQTIDIISGSDQITAPIPTGGPKRIAPRRPQVESSCVPVISSVQSLASPNGPASPSGRVAISRADVNMVTQVATPLAIPTTVAPMPAPPPQIYQQIITKPPPAKQMKNKSILCKPYSHTKGVSCRPHPCMKETQTDQSLNKKFLIPIPVPIYVPAPMHMFATPFPVPVPFPLPVPVPIFIPTTRNSAKGIFKEIKKIQEKIPTDPFEAELLMMAEMVAGDKKQDPTDSESEDGNEGDDGGDGTFSPENVDTSNTFGEDMLQMALKMASELEEPAVDMESVLTSNTITTNTQPTVDPNKTLYASDTDQVNVMTMNRGRKRSVRGSRNSSGGTPSKRGRRTSGSVDVPLLPPPEPVPPPRIEVEKPDANMCLKYTFGVNAWRHWVMQKNAELEKAAMTNRKIKLFKPELLQLTADELNFSLCLFVKEVRKPNGTEYAPDTIYYLCLGIQQYLFENGRIDNIFTDSYYEKFTDCLDEVAKKFAALYNDSQYIVTRVEEEHLWESKQLGAHSPHVLLSTLMFFNTKHFNLVTVEEHMQLSFSHIMKHWKRNPNTPGVAKVPGSRNVLLRFYPPQSALEANSRKKKVYEQQENEENPLRCPVKLYEFYLSKCPESVKTRNDVFYLLPERSCVPDSPVWYSTMALGKEPLMKMLHRVKMVKEINMALLSC